MLPGASDEPMGGSGPPWPDGVDAEVADEDDGAEEDDGVVEDGCCC